MIEVKVKISTRLINTNNQFNFEIKENSSIIDLFQILGDSEMLDFLSDWKQDELPSQLLILVNGINVNHRRGKDTLLGNGDCIHILPIAVGG